MHTSSVGRNVKATGCSCRLVYPRGFELGRLGGFGLHWYKTLFRCPLRSADLASTRVCWACLKRKQTLGKSRLLKRGASLASTQSRQARVLCRISYTQHDIKAFSDNCKLYASHLAFQFLYTRHSNRQICIQSTRGWRCSDSDPWFRSSFEVCLKKRFCRISGHLLYVNYID